MRLKSISKFLLSAALMAGLLVLPAAAVEKEKVIDLTGTKFQIVIPNYVETTTVEIDGDTYNVLVAEKPTAKSEFRYNFFTIKTTDSNATYIMSTVRNSAFGFDQIGDLMADFENGSIVYSPTMYEDFEEIALNSVFLFKTTAYDANNESIGDISVMFKFVASGTSTTTPSATPTSSATPTPAAAPEASATPAPSESPAPAEKAAAAKTASKVLVNGKDVAFEAYAIEGYNYFKLRDLAAAVNGSEKQFEVTWDGSKNAINLLSETAYTVAGGELAAGTGAASADAVLTNSTIYLNGEVIELQAYTINGFNYFKLRDVAKVFDFGITWDGTLNQIGIDTANSYTE